MKEIEKKNSIKSEGIKLGVARFAYIILKSC